MAQAQEKFFRQMREEFMDLAEIESLFTERDEDGDKELTEKEMVDYAESIGIFENPKVTKEDFKKRFQKMDKDGSKKVSLEEYVHYMEIDWAFGKFDMEGTGKIDINQLLDGSYLFFDHQLSVDEAKKIFKEIDKNDDKFISRDEFQLFMEKSEFKQQAVRFQMLDEMDRYLYRIEDDFNNWDTDGSGTIDLKDFIDYARYSGEMTELTAAAMFHEMDKDDSGHIDTYELRTYLQIEKLWEVLTCESRSRYPDAITYQEASLAAKKVFGKDKGKILAALQKMDVYSEGSVPLITKQEFVNGMNYPDLPKKEREQRTKNDILKMMRVSQEHIDKWFNILDKDGNNKINIKDLKDGNIPTGIPIMDEFYFFDSVEKLDIDGNGEVSKEELRLLCKVIDAFSKIDVNKDRKLCKHELEMAASKIFGTNTRSREVAELINKMNVGGETNKNDKTVSFEEFKNAMLDWQKSKK